MIPKGHQKAYITTLYLKELHSDENTGIKLAGKALFNNKQVKVVGLIPVFETEDDAAAFAEDKGVVVELPVANFYGDDGSGQ